MHISVGALIVSCSSSECRAANRLTSYLGTFWSKKSSTADPILSGWLIGLLGLLGRPRGAGDQAARPQSITLATHADISGSNRMRYGAQLFSRRAMLIS